MFNILLTLVSVKEISEWVGMIGSAMAVATTVVVLFRKWIYKPFRAWIKRIDGAIAELKPNGGTSIKDTIRRIDSKIFEIQARTVVIQDASEKAIFECNASGECIYVNKALSDLFGLERSDMLNKGWLEAVDKEDRINVWKEWNDFIVNDIPYEAEYYIHNKRTGQKIKCIALARSFKDNEGKSIGIHGFVEPVRNLDESEIQI